MFRIIYRFLVPGCSAKPLVSAHDRIMGTHTLRPRCALHRDGDNLDQIRPESAVAKLRGTWPILSSSAQTNRHRLYAGDHCQANAALYRIVIVCTWRHHRPRSSALTTRNSVHT